MRGLGLLAGLLVLAVAPLAQAEETCDRIEAFHAAAFDVESELDGARWIEMHWVGKWMDFEKGFGLRCVNSGEDVSRELCSWLAENTSIEFADNLPMRILECFGYHFPRPWGEWREWRSDISLLRDHRFLLLEIDLTDAPGDSGVVRLSSFATGKSDATVDLPPLARGEAPRGKPEGEEE